MSNNCCSFRSYHSLRIPHNWSNYYSSRIRCNWCSYMRSTMTSMTSIRCNWSCS
jgi:hypothetical protein